MPSTYSLTYASTATRDLSEADLLALLDRARTVNARLGVTGLLLYSPGTGGNLGTFVQVLEGPRAAVQALYIQITRDSRHRDCSVIKEGSGFQRRFSDWTMGFRNLSVLAPGDIPGFNPVFLQDWTLQKVLAEKDPVLQLLYSFAGT